MKKSSIGLIVLASITAAAVLSAVLLYIFWIKEPVPMDPSSADGSPPYIDSENLPPMDDASVSEAPPEDEVPGYPEGSLSDWNLILLNPESENKIGSDISINLETISDNGGQSIDSRAAGSYEEMRSAAQAEGISLFLRSGFRSMATQEQNYSAAIKRNMESGMSEEEALEATSRYYTLPGHSEHHTGLALDIITPEYHRDVYSLDDRFAETEAYQWLVRNCADYGFILRYPAEKEDMTQISFEPWHYRYVGSGHAQYIMKHGLCLEEYVDLLRRAGR